MNKKAIGLQILWWSELVISLRVLLFSIPVIINRNMAQSFVASNPGDTFIILITIAAVLYFIAGVMAVAKLKSWKFLHYLIFIVIVTGTLVPLVLLSKETVVGLQFFLPLLISIIVTMLAVILDKK